MRDDRDRGLAHGLGGVAVGDHAVGHRAVELVEVAELVEGGGDLGVRRVGHRTFRRLRGRAWPAPPGSIVPTYNEAENLEAAGARRAGRASPEARILVVDDASPDGTGELADALAARDPAVEVLHRPGKAGLGLAYVAGFAHALRGGAGYVVEMDADLSHDPRRPAAAARARGRDGADLVLGSRYVRRRRRRGLGPAAARASRAAAAATRARVLGVGVRDLTGGFKCFRADTLRAIDFETVRSEGYAFQVELTYRALARGLRVEEVPITLPRPQRRRLEDVGPDRARGDLAGARAAARPPARRAPEAPGSGEPGTLPIPEA